MEKKLNEELSHMISVAKAAEDICVMMCNQVEAKRCVEEHRVFLQEANGKDWVDKLSKVMNSGKRETAQKMLRENLELWAKKLLKTYSLLTEHKPEVSLLVFVKAINRMVNAGNILGIGSACVTPLVDNAHKVLDHYRNHQCKDGAGYDTVAATLGILYPGGEAIEKLRHCELVALKKYYALSVA